MPLKSMILALSLLTATPGLTQDLLDDQALEAQRGGLRTPDGVEFHFGAQVNTYVDGQLALQTQLSWTENGIVSSNGPGQNVISLPGMNGETVLIHDIADQRIANLVLNSADNRNILQDTNVSLYLPQLDQVQKDFNLQQVKMQLDGALGRALVDGVR